MSRKPRTVTLIVTANLPSGVTAREFRDFVRDEIKAAPGGLHPADLLFDLDRANVNVEVPNKYMRRIIDLIRGSIVRARQTAAALEIAPVTREWFK